MISFDVDQTLLDFQRVLDEALREVERFFIGHGINTNAAQLQSIRNDIELKHRTGKVDLLEIRRMSFVEIAGGDQLLAGKALSLFKDVRFGAAYLFDDTIPVLEHLKKRFRIGWLTNGNSTPKAAGIAHLFDYVVYSHDHGFQKPDARIFAAMANKAGGIAASAFVHVGDSLETDVAGANNYGAKSVWLNRGGKLNNSAIQPNWEVRNLFDLCDILDVSGPNNPK
ncbi:MAG: HAD family hydrolase [Paracoccaceae bacterium]